MTAATPASFSAADASVLALLRDRSEDLRAALHLLARIGVRWRRAEAERCRDWIAQLETHPLYKGGQVLFDLLEFEDFLLDGDPPSSPAAEALNALLQRVSAALRLPPIAVTPPSPLPALEAGFYLYRDVVLGGLAVLRQAREDSAVAQ